MTFKELNLINPILHAIKEEGYETPSPIQARAIPLLLEGKDLLGCAQTGTGKTAAFAIPILQTLYKNRMNSKTKRTVKALILTPTRELAAQVGKNFKIYGHYTGLKTAVIFGGVAQGPQVSALHAGVDVLVATPGRLCDLMGQKQCNLSNVSMFVLDEADRMLDMGFIHDVKKVITLIPKERQTLLFSATMPKEIDILAKTILRNPATVIVTPVSSPVDVIEQFVYFVDKANKRYLLIDLLKDDTITSVLVFSRTKHGADRIGKILNKAKITAGVIHGGKSQGARQNALADFVAGRTRVLVATDIAARGIDIDQLSHVINYDLPNEPETYVHRIGRTGRAGLGGTAISFCDFDEKVYLHDIQKLMGKNIPVIEEHLYPMKIFEHIEPKTQPRRKHKDDNVKSREKCSSSKRTEVRKKSEYSTESKKSTKASTN
jgi:Superfamily II DNA and RNA helicases